MLGRRGGVGPWAGAVHLHHLVKVVFVGVLPCAAATSPFLVNKYPGEDSLSLCKHAVTSRAFARAFAVLRGRGARGVWAEPLPSFVLLLLIGILLLSLVPISFFIQSLIYITIMFMLFEGYNPILLLFVLLLRLF